MSREQSHRAQAGPASSRSRRRTEPEGDGGVGAASRRVACLTFSLGSLAILGPGNRTSGLVIPNPPEQWLGSPVAEGLGDPSAGAGEKGSGPNGIDIKPNTLLLRDRGGQCEL